MKMIFFSGLYNFDQKVLLKPRRKIREGENFGGKRLIEAHLRKHFSHHHNRDN
jgi:hypothetical protein